MITNLFIYKIVEIILYYVKKRGRVTKISDDCSINRGELTADGIACMKFYRLIRLFYGICLNLNESEFEEMMKRIYYSFVENTSKYDFQTLKKRDVNQG